jgi:hypothetical protein
MLAVRAPTLVPLKNTPAASVLVQMLEPPGDLFIDQSSKGCIFPGAPDPSLITEEMLDVVRAKVADLRRERVCVGFAKHGLCD